MSIASPATSTVEIADLYEREQALDITTSCIVEAPAGSGKTGLLIQRFLRLLGTVDEPGEVLALTFTKKATAEMTERVLKALRQASSATLPPDDRFQCLTHTFATSVLQRDRERGWRLLERPHLLNIRTIDSLCGGIVRAVPISAGETAAAQPVNDPQPLYLRAAHAVMMRFGGGDDVLNDAIQTVLMHRDGDLAFCERVLAEMLATRDQWGSLVPLGERLTEEHLEAVTLPRLNASLQRTICSALEEARDGLEESTLDEICRIAERHAFEPGYNGNKNPLACCAGLQRSPGCNAADLPHWQAITKLILTADKFRSSFHANHVGTTIGKNDRERLREILEAIACDELFARLDSIRLFSETTFPADQWHVSKALFRLLEHALVELKLLFAREQVCDFAEVALAARTALNAHEGNVQELLGTKLRHLLVDEMQDTSAGQYDLLEQLTAAWDGSSQTVFLVGDPKQSIYLFRQARVDRFQQCMTDALLGDIRLRVLPLTANFRSGRRIVGECNETFRAIFPAEHPAEGDVVFHAANAANPERPGEGMHWSIEAIPASPDPAEKRRERRSAVRREARDAAALLGAAYEHWQTQRQRRIETGDTSDLPFRAAVLTRARTHVIEIARQLEKAGLPYRAIDLKPLAEQQEVLDLFAITRALLHPADRVAWLALLRAPWCGLELAHLHTLAAGDNPQHARESLRARLRERAASLPEDAAQRVLQTLDVMDGALQHTGVETLAGRVERTWRSLGGDLYLSPLEQENVGEYLRVLDTMEAEGEPVTLANLKRRLERLFARPGTAANAIDIMTIHRAKGLEWDLVLLPGLHRAPSRDAFSALEWLELPTRSPEDGSGDVLLAPLPGKGGEPGSLLNLIRSRKRARNYAEIKRLFYVAVTRARTSLHLFASPEAGQNGRILTRAGTLLHAAWPAAQAYATLRETPPQEAAEEPLASAAVAEIVRFPAPSVAKEVRLPDIERLDGTIHPVAHLRSTVAPYASATPARKRFHRPEGTFGARAVGNAIHAFVERLATEIAQRTAAGESAAEAAIALSGEVSAWQPAIRATLRASSLPPTVLERASETVLRALAGILSSEEGRWILAPHSDATAESAWQTGAAGEETRIRLDRSFFAASEPLAAGDDTLWIVDFKTGDRTGPNETDDTRDAFLKEERKHYGSQLHTYAEIRRATLPAGTPIRLALFYPLMNRLLWWNFEESGSNLAGEAMRPHPTAERSSASEEVSQFDLLI